MFFEFVSMRKFIMKFKSYIEIIIGDKKRVEIEYKICENFAEADVSCISLLLSNK